MTTHDEGTTSRVLASIEVGEPNRLAKLRISDDADGVARSVAELLHDQGTLAAQPSVRTLGTGGSDQVTAYVDAGRPGLVAKVRLSGTPGDVERAATALLGHLAPTAPSPSDDDF